MCRQFFLTTGQFYRTACIALCESGDFAKFKTVYEDESACFDAGSGDHASLLALCLLHDSHTIFTFLLQRSVLSQLNSLHEESKLPLLLYTAIVLHRNRMFQELFTLGLGIDDPNLVVQCCNIAIHCCNWELLDILFRNSRCDVGSEKNASLLIYSAVSSLHAPSVLLLLQTVFSRCGSDFLKKCINTLSPKGLTILNVLMLLLRSSERDPSAICNFPLSYHSLFRAQLVSLLSCSPKLLMLHRPGGFGEVLYRDHATRHTLRSESKFQ
jgi:hypothetical protein